MAKKRIVLACRKYVSFYVSFCLLALLVVSFLVSFYLVVRLLVSFFVSFALSIIGLVLSSWFCVVDISYWPGTLFPICFFTQYSFSVSFFVSFGLV